MRGIKPCASLKNLARPKTPQEILSATKNKKHLVKLVILRLSEWSKLRHAAVCKDCPLCYSNQHFSARGRECGPDVTNVRSYLRPNPLAHNGPIHKSIRYLCSFLFAYR